jgi:hypothetical protein
VLDHEAPALANCDDGRGGTGQVGEHVVVKHREDGSQCGGGGGVEFSKQENTPSCG